MNQNNDNDFVFIYNREQVIFYIQNGVNPIMWDVHKKTGNIYCVFKRPDTFKVYKLWCDNKALN